MTLDTLADLHHYCPASDRQVLAAIEMRAALAKAEAIEAAARGCLHRAPAALTGAGPGASVAVETPRVLFAE